MKQCGDKKVFGKEYIQLLKELNMREDIVEAYEDFNENNKNFLAAQIVDALNKSEISSMKKNCFSKNAYLYIDERDDSQDIELPITKTKDGSINETEQVLNDTEKELCTLKDEFLDIVR